MSVRPAVVLEPAAQQLVAATVDPQFLMAAGPAGGRRILDDRATHFLPAALAAK